MILIQVWGRLRLVTEELEVRLVATEHRRTPPRIGDEVSVVTGARHDDRFWAGRVGEVLGEPVVWRVLGGWEPRAGGLGIDGCFLQRPSLLATTNYGVMCWQDADGGLTRLSRYRDVDAELWRAVQQTAGGFDRVQCGNCVFESADWLAYLATNVFPPDQKLCGELIW